MQVEANELNVRVWSQIQWFSHGTSVGIGSSRSSQVTKRPGPSELVLDLVTMSSGL
jgi:hypothetical protein